MFYENSCASGSCAVCAYLSRENDGKTKLVLKQKGGNLRVSSSNMTNYINLEGNVKIQNHYFEELLYA